MALIFNGLGAFGGSPTILGLTGEMGVRRPPANSVWQYGSHAMSYVYGAASKCSEFVGRQIATQFFYPLTLTSKQRQLHIEEGFTSKYLRGEKVPPLNNLRILENFNHTDKSFKIKLKDGKEITVTFRVFETNEKMAQATQSENAPFYELAYVGGNHCTKESTIAPLDAYMQAFLNKRQEQQMPSRGRFFFLTPYDASANGKLFIPRTDEEAGYILAQTFCFIEETYGRPPAQAIFHSLAGILFGKALQFFNISTLKALPRHILFDRCPASIYAACKNVNAACIPIGRMLYPFAYLTGWASNLAQDIANFCTKFKTYIKSNNIVISIIDIRQDHRFGNGRLGNAIEIDGVRAEHSIFISRTLFDPTQQILHEVGHHGVRASQLYGADIEEGDTEYFTAEETLADSVMNESLLHKIPTEKKKSTNDHKEKEIETEKDV